jgi:hypothetical protein
MACKLTKAQMLELVSRHEIAEGTGDVAAAMATLGEETFHELHPLGVKIRERASVNEMYRRVLPSQKQTVAGGKRNAVWFSADGMLCEYEFAVVTEGRPAFVSRVMVAFGFRDELIYSERVFLGPDHADIFLAALGSDFLSLPGVSVER